VLNRARGKAGKHEDLAKATSHTGSVAMSRANVTRTRFQSDHDQNQTFDVVEPLSEARRQTFDVVEPLSESHFGRSEAPIPSTAELIDLANAKMRHGK
jgi:hypothetical protein